jgi:hypothetical protein
MPEENPVKIASTALNMMSDHAALTRRQTSESMQTWRGGQQNAATGANSATSVRRDRDALSAASQASISDAGWQSLLAAIDDRATVSPAPTFLPGDANAQSSQAIDDAFNAAENDPIVSLIRRMIEMLTGKEVKVFDASQFSAEFSHAEASSGATASRQTQTAGRSGFGFAYDYHSVYEEAETTNFSAQGVVRTADGQTIDFQLDLSMSRYYHEETQVNIRAGEGARKDPLVVNFGGTAAQLAGATGQRFSFDLDGDGQLDSLPTFASGSGYLALDLNGNGRIDSGKELFGPQTGNGFSELAKLDSDGNGWIDEGDPVFAKLAVWSPDANGQHTLTSLGNLGIGALGLAHVATPFELRDGQNKDLGAVKASGVYLTESGQVGNLQEIDLTV